MFLYGIFGMPLCPVPKTPSSFQYPSPCRERGGRDREREGGSLKDEFPDTCPCDDRVLERFPAIKEKFDLSTKTVQDASPERFPRRYFGEPLTGRSASFDRGQSTEETSPSPSCPSPLTFRDSNSRRRSIGMYSLTRQGTF
jgi:hypothetical protein